jgi:AcrR family transcriptional regulator
MTAVTMKEGVSRLKRDLILGAAAKLFSERGYAATTIEAMTEELKASKRSIYEHFAGKSDILVVICEQAVRFSVELAEDVRREPADPTAKLRRLARDFTMIVIENQDHIAIASREMKFLPDESRRRILRLQERFDRILAGILGGGVAAGVLNIADPEMTGLAISGMIIWIHSWYRPSGRLTPGEVAECMAEAALRMAGAPIAREQRR